MYSPEENYSHVKQKKFSSGFNCENKPKISLNKCTDLSQKLTHYQLNELEHIFDKNKNQFPSIYFRRELAKKMSVPQIKIHKWFNNKIRKKIRNQNKYIRFKYHELIELKRVFEKNHYPDKNIRNDLAQRMGVSEVKISKWFAVRRHKLKKYVSSSTCAGYDNFITTSTGDVNYPSAPFYSRAETIAHIDPYRYPYLQSQADFSATFSAEQYSSHHVPLTYQWTDSDTQSFSTVGSSTYYFPSTVTYSQSVLTSL